MSDSVRPHRQQPTRLPRPWDSPGKNTGVGCHVLLQCMRVKSESEVAQSCLTLHNPMDYSLPGSSVNGIFQARVLEWGAIAFSENMVQLTLTPEMFECSAKGGIGCKSHGPGEDNLDGYNPACRINPNRNKERQETERTQYGMRLWIQPSLTQFSLVQFFATLWTIVCQAPLSMGFSRQEYWSGLPCPLPGDLPDPRIKPASPASLALQVDSLPQSHGGNLDPATCKTKSTSGLCSFESQYYFLSLKVQFSRSVVSNSL